MSRTPLSHRKNGSSTFIPDITSASIAQYTPRLSIMSRHMEPRSPFTLSQKPHSNFIADTIITEGPRALSVSETGEKRQIDLNDEIHKFHTNPFISSRNASFIVIDGKYPSAEVSPNILENHLLTVETDETKAISGDFKSIHLKKKATRHINPKARLQFTPRATSRSIGLTTESSEDLLENGRSNFNVQTQTETICENCSRSCQVSIPQPVSGKRKHSKRKEMHSHDQKASEISFKHLLPNALLAMHLQNASKSNQRLKLPIFLQSSSPSPSPSPPTTPSPPPSPPKRRPTFRSTSRSTLRSTSTATATTKPFSQTVNIEEFSEVSCLAEIVTFITVISILMLALFQVNGTRELLIKLWYNLKAILLNSRRKPKSKREMFTEFFSDFWL